MQEETIKENIKYYTELFKSCILVILAIATGVLTLLLKETRTTLENYLLCIGGSLMLCSAAYTIFIHNRINTLLNDLP
jgi:hypothetical protein